MVNATTMIETARDLMSRMDYADLAVVGGVLLNLLAVAFKRGMISMALVRAACVVKCMGPHLVDAVRYSSARFTSDEEARAFLGLAAKPTLELAAVKSAERVE